MLIGLSASICIKEIVAGKVRRRDVAYIIASIDPTHGLSKSVGNGLSDIADLYQRLYWYENQEQCKDLFFELYNEGKILCPRMIALNPSVKIPTIFGGVWLECKQTYDPGLQDKIEWVSL